MLGPCYRCGDLGHLIAACPEFRPPSSKAEHFTRLALYKQRLDNWLEGNPGIKWNPEMKKQAIEAENRMWEKVKAA